ncbi:MAG: hypothetical protein HY904_06855 [Deltaproteobacteria bacterium]|nr:hypothetical protein [Deltaproteobacteria bacterium]
MTRCHASLAARATTWLLLSLSVAALNCRCDQDRLDDTQGTLRVTVTNPPANTPLIQVTAQDESDAVHDGTSATVWPETRVDLKELEAGTWQVRVAALDQDGIPLNAVWVSNVLIAGGRTTEVRVDMAQGIPITAEICDGLDNDRNGNIDEPLSMPLCSECARGFEVPLTDDDRCGPIACTPLDRNELLGDNTAAGTSSCVRYTHGPITTARCTEIGRCVSPTPDRCTDVTAATLAQAGLCQLIEGCVEGNPQVVQVPDGTSCGTDKVCSNHQCLPVCNPSAVAVCHRCSGGADTLASDDERCGTIDCDGLDRHDLRGDNTAAGTSSCVRVDYSDLTSGRCDASGQCAAANSAACTSPAETTVATAGLCHTLSGCEGGSPTVETSPEDTPCGGGKVCRSGNCITVTPPPSVGCADNAREGFLDTTAYPSIAACAGAWSVPGLTRSNLVPTCNRAAGDDGTNTDGTGCAAADLCATGWHVCLGATEVGQHAASCADAVPPGAPDKAYFFAVAQTSTSNTVCDTTTNDNDVFGCGNLGVLLTSDKMCGPLTRALASTQANSCGYNEAEPNLGPWQCQGDATSHLHEGAIVTKKGCPNNSCSYSGNPVGNSDKGGVLCCRD